VCSPAIPANFNGASHSPQSCAAVRWSLLSVVISAPLVSQVPCRALVVFTRQPRTWTPVKHYTTPRQSRRPKIMRCSCVTSIDFLRFRWRIVAEPKTVFPQVRPALHPQQEHRDAFDVVRLRKHINPTFPQVKPHPSRSHQPPCASDASPTPAATPTPPPHAHPGPDARTASSSETTRAPTGVARHTTAPRPAPAN
jgi:hypothetical protein